MKRSSVALLGVLSAGFALVLASGCSDDDTSVAVGGAAGTAGSSGKGGGGAGGEGGAHAGTGGGGAGGVAGEGGAPHAEAGFGGADLGGAPGAPSMAGEGGTSGASEAGSGGEGGAMSPCGPALAKPDVPADIAVTSSALLVAAYAAEGTQIYTCTPTVTGEVTTYAWSTASVPDATLYGQNCTVAATHYAGPHWRANDGSIILGTKVRSDPSGTAASIPRLLLSAAVDGGVTGLLTPVTAVQRLDTVGGIAPITGCDAAHANGTVAVPYTANYYFYSGASTIPPAP
jgi:Protein of unknown function (DUF3455)